MPGFDAFPGYVGCFHGVGGGAGKGGKCHKSSCIERALHGRFATLYNTLQQDAVLLRAVTSVDCLCEHASKHWYLEHAHITCNDMVMAKLWRR